MTRVNKEPQPPSFAELVEESNNANYEDLLRKMEEEQPLIPPMLSKEMIRSLQEHLLLLKQLVTGQKPEPPIVAEQVDDYKQYVQQQNEKDKSTGHHLSLK
jgi:hypothetical protein